MKKETPVEQVLKQYAIEVVNLQIQVATLVNEIEKLKEGKEEADKGK